MRERKVLRSEKGKGLGCRLCYEQRREVDRGLLRMITINFYMDVGRTALQ
jgi:hypothetical protein